MPTPSFILPTSVPVVDATVEALRVYDGDPAGFDVLPMSFTRGSSATRTDSAGNIVEAVPYNLLQQSETFNTTWVQVRSTVSPNTIAAPNGTLTADSLFDSIDNNIHYVSQTITALNGPATLSIYAKANQLTQIQVAAIGGTTAMGRGFDLSSGTTFTESVGGVSSNDLGQSITAVGDGWYRCTMSWTATGQTSIFILTSSAGAATYTGTGTNGLYIWGAQLVVGTEPLPYQETVTRLALPRLDYRNADGTLSSTPRLLLEPQRTNSIRNSTMVGAVVGSPGTWPTGWLSINTAGLTNSVVGIGTENGLQYIDMRYNGIATGTGIRIGYTLETQTAALTGQVWTITNYLKIISQPNPPYAYFLRDTERNSSGVVVASDLLSIVPTTTLQRFTFVKTLNGGATTAYVVPELQIQTIIGQAYDFTIRIAAPQLELGAFATTFIPTSTAAVTRLADQAIINNADFLPTGYPFTLFSEIYLTNTILNNSITFLDSASATSYYQIEQQGNVWFAAARPSSTSVTASATVSTGVGTHKVAAVFTSTTIKLFLDGALVATAANTQAFNSSINDLMLGQLRIVSDTLTRTPVANAAVYNQELTDEQLISLTTL